MKVYLTVLMVFLGSSCSGLKTTITKSGIDVSNNGLSKKQSEIIFDNAKQFPNNTQLSLALIKSGKIKFIGIETKDDTIKLIENYNKVFEIGSITKVFTATLLSNFFNDQKLKLDDKA